MINFRSSKKISIIFSSIALSFFSSYAVFYFHGKSLSKSTLENWLKAESINIVEGNLLSALTKYRRAAISEGEIIRIAAIDFSQQTPQQRISIGEAHELTFDSSAFTSNVQSMAHFPWKFSATVMIENNAKIGVIFTIFPKTGFNFTLLLFLISSILLSTLGIFIKEQEKRNLKERERVAKETLEKVAQQISHDIKSPLSALNIVTAKYLATDSPEKDLAMAAIQKIDSLAKEILNKEDNSNRGCSLREIQNALNTSSKEIRGLFPNTPLNIENRISVKDLQIPVNELPLQRILANLLKNSYEAIEEMRSLSTTVLDSPLIGNLPQISVTLKLSNTEKVFRLEVIDSGCGVSDDRLPNLGLKKYSTKGSEGHGIGLNYVVESVHSSQGTIQFAHNSPNGLIVRISWPIIV